jgi:alpha-soluble NSF attachment protein
MRWSVKDYLFKAGICYLANNDMVLTENKLQEFKKPDFQFESTRECAFLTALVQTMKDGDEQAFTDHSTNFDLMNKLDGWKVRVLVAAKKHIQVEDFS